MRTWRLAFPMAALLWGITLYLPVYSASGPRDGTVYVINFYGFIPALWHHAAELFSQLSVLMTFVVWGILPALVHTASCLGIAYLAARGMFSAADALQRRENERSA